MTVDNKTPLLNIPLPDIQNKLSDDVGRIQSALNLIDQLIDSKASKTELAAAVTAAITDLIDSSPAALNTLNELAAALGDDPNFATTMATQLGLKLDKASYTAADVLAKILTVHGSGSGLDADKLDGMHASAFATAAQGAKADTAVQPAALGTAASKNVSATGNADTTEVVLGGDTRLSDPRPASDVSAWAKAATKPVYTAAEVGAQPSDADLTAIAGLAGTSGLLKKTAADTWALDTTAYLPLSGGTMTGDLSLKGDATQALHPVTLQQLQSLLAGLKPKASVKAATTANITLSGTQTVDGVALVAGDRVLVKNQTTASQNGIYIVAAGAWTRATDSDTWLELVAALVVVEQGTVNADCGWVCTADQGGTLGTTAVTWTQFFGPGAVTAGTGISVSGTQVSLAALTDSGAGSLLKLTRDAYGRVSGTAPVTASDITGLSGLKMPVANGGTNSTATPTLGGVAVGTGTAYAFTAAGISGQVLKSGGGAAPSWQDAIGSSELEAVLSTVGLGALGALVRSNPDFDSLTKPGFYFVTGQSQVNSPDNSDLSPLPDHLLLVVSSGTDECAQISFTTSGRVFFRLNDSSGFSVWRRFGLTADASGYSVGDLICAETSESYGKISDVATGNVLLSGGVGAAPSYGKVGLTTHVAGTLPAANGGTGISSFALGDIAYASGATALSKLAGNATTTKKFLSQTGTGTASAAPAWSALTSADVGLGNADNTADLDKPVSNATRDWVESLSGKNSVRVATADVLGGVNYATTQTITARTTLAATGTTTSGSTSISAVSNAIYYIKVGATISGAGIPAGATVTAVASSTITISAAATATGTSVALTITNPLSALVVDGITLAVGNRVLVKNESASKNGLYTLTTLGTASVPWVLTRTTDGDAWADLVGAQVAVEEGATNAETSWLCTANSGGTLGSTSLTWQLVSNSKLASLGNTTLAVGDTIYASGTTSLTKLAGNTTTTRKFMRQTGTGSASAAPAWDTLTLADLPSWAVGTSGVLSFTSDGVKVAFSSGENIYVGDPNQGYGAALQAINGSNVSVLNSGGLHFSNTVDNSAANTLSWYETGTYTPVLKGATTAGTFTYSTQLGRYTRIGRMVYIDVNVTVTGASVAPAGNLYITLPKTAISDTNKLSQAAAITNNLTITGQAFVQTQSGSVNASVLAVNNGALTAVVSSSDTAFTIQFSLAYVAA